MLKTTMRWWMVLALGLAACGGGDDSGGGGAGGGGTTGGPIACAKPTDPNNGRVACPGGSPAAEDALATLGDFRKIAEGTGESVRWLGGVLGQQIARDGTPTGGTLSLWMAGFCLGGTGPSDLGDALNLSTNGAECLAQNQCQTLDCSQSPDYPFPKVDASAAIATAFPNDPAGSVYSVQYTAAIGDFWTIGNAATSTTVKIDATTGAVVP
jgi:hypothetical protein